MSNKRSAEGGEDASEGRLRRCWLHSPSRSLGLGHTGTQKQPSDAATARGTLVPRRWAYRVGRVAVVGVVAGKNFELVCPSLEVQFHSNH